MARVLTQGETVVVGEYRYYLRKELGRGAFAVVYDGEHTRSLLPVAVKVVDTSGLSQKARRRLETEIEIMRSIEHPNVVRCFFALADSSRQQTFMVLERCSYDFATLLRRSPFSRIDERLGQIMMSQLASGLFALRERRLVHRDLKPQNLLMVENDAGVILKIGDLGFARQVGPESVAASCVGTPLYMAPEVYLGTATDKADLWSVGVIMYQMLTGKAPISVKSEIELRQQLLLRAPIPMPVGLSAACVHLLGALLQYDQRSRISWDDFFLHPWLRLRDTASHTAASLLPPPSSAAVLSPSLARTPIEDVTPSAIQSSIARDRHEQQPQPQQPRGGNNTARTHARAAALPPRPPRAAVGAAIDGVPAARRRAVPPKSQRGPAASSLVPAAAPTTAKPSAPPSQLESSVVIEHEPETPDRVLAPTAPSSNARTTTPPTTATAVRVPPIVAVQPPPQPHQTTLPQMAACKPQPDDTMYLVPANEDDVRVGAPDQSASAFLGAAELDESYRRIAELRERCGKALSLLASTSLVGDIMVQLGRYPAATAVYLRVLTHLQLVWRAELESNRDVALHIATDAELSYLVDRLKQMYTRTLQATKHCHTRHNREVHEAPELAFESVPTADEVIYSHTLELAKEGAMLEAKRDWPRSERLYLNALQLVVYLHEQASHDEDRQHLFSSTWQSLRSTARWQYRTHRLRDLVYQALSERHLVVQQHLQQQFAGAF